MTLGNDFNDNVDSGSYDGEENMKNVIEISDDRVLRNRRYSNAGKRSQYAMWRDLLFDQNSLNGKPLLPEYLENKNLYFIDKSITNFDEFILKRDYYISKMQAICSNDDCFIDNLPEYKYLFNYIVYFQTCMEELTKHACDCKPECIRNNIDSSGFINIKYVNHESLSNNEHRLQYCRPFNKPLGFNSIKVDRKFVPLRSVNAVSQGMKSLCDKPETFDKLKCDTSLLYLECDDIPDCYNNYLPYEEFECTREGFNNEIKEINEILKCDFYKTDNRIEGSINMNESKAQENKWISSGANCSRNVSTGFMVMAVLFGAKSCKDGIFSSKGIVYKILFLISLLVITLN